MSNNEEWWNELIEKRKKEAIGLVKVKDIISKDLYPDNTHFIYELLQNAEDTKATEVSFELFSDRLIFKHNGKRLFSRTDIERITDINNYDTQEEKKEIFGVETIGKFGIGFKAVFGYTDTPQIHSGEFHFKIYDLVVPKQISSIEMSLDETIMVFPFNHTHQNKQKCKTPKIAFSEIKIWLENIKDNTLLFLTNIKKISYYINDKVNHLERYEIDDYRIKITNTKNNTTTKWLRFKKDVTKKDGLYVSVAFQLAIDNMDKEYIKPITGAVSIFFPAKKEVSKLKFHIHAPFVSTVSRDSMIDNLQENNELRDLISDLLLDVLEYLKDNQLLDYKFLACMPNNEDNLSEFYLPIQKKLVYYFNNNSFLVTDTGIHRSASECFLINTKEARSVLSENILKNFMLYFYNRNFEEIYYLDSEKLKYRTRQKSFIEMLEIENFDNTRLLNLLEKLANESDDNITDMIQGELYEWFSNLYVFLNLYYTEYFLDKPQFKKFILLFDNTLNTTQKDCYFSKIKMKHLLIVKESVYFRNHEAKNFLEQKLGVKEVGEKETIEIILKENYQKNFVEKEKHIEHIRKFLTYYQRHKTDIEFFKNYRFIKVSENDEYEKPKKVYIDSPFKKTGMSAIGKDDKSLFSLNEIYHKLEKDKKMVFIEFLERLGSISQLSIKVIEEKNDKLPSNFYNYVKWCEKIAVERGGQHRLFRDFDFKYSDIFKKDSVDISLLIWNTVKDLKEDKLKAYYRFKTKEDSKKDLIDDSTLLYKLKINKWIPNKEGKFYKPQDISRDMLPSEFKYEQGNIWLQAIGFGENIKENEEEFKKKKQIVEDVTGGHNIKDIEKLKDIAPDELRKFIEQQQHFNLFGAMESHEGEASGKLEEIDPSIIIDKEKYLTKAQKELENILKKSTIETKNYISTKKVKVGVKETKVFLEEQYHGYCQICGFTFTKRKKGTGQYFELFDWFSEKITKQKVNVVQAGSSLSLCARCHSGVKYGSFKADLTDILKDIDISQLSFEDFVSKISISVDKKEIPECYDFIEMDMYKVNINLFNEEEVIFYTEEHFLHLYTMLRSGGE